MTYLVAAILGVVQGLTEFLPVSSTAHLLVLERVFGYEDPGGAFTVMIQLGSILAVMWLYRPKIATVVRGLPADPDARRFAAALLVAFVPVVIVGLVAGDYVQNVVYGNVALIAWALVIGGFIMLGVERWRPDADIVDAEKIPMGRALGVGICQTLAAVLPGISRSGATIMGGMLMRLDRPAAAEFSFFLAMPTMMAAFVDGLMDVRGQLAPERAGEIAVGFAAAFFASLAVVRPFLGFVRRAGFAPFAWYRVAVGLLILGVLFVGQRFSVAVQP